MKKIVKRAEKYLTDLMDHPEEKGVKEVQQNALRDVLTDFRHLADAKGLDFHKALDGSYEVYLDEKYEAYLEEKADS